MARGKLLEMSTEKDQDDLLLSDEQAAKLAEQVRDSHTSGKLLTSKQDLLTPKGKAEAIVVDSLESAAKCIVWILQAKPPEGVNSDAMKATAAHAKTQAQLAMWVLDKASGIQPAAQRGRPSAADVGQLHVNAVTMALQKRLAAKQRQEQALSQRRERARFVEAVPAQAEHTSVVDTQSQNVAADGVRAAADGDTVGEG